MKVQKIQKGIFLLPSFFSLTNLFFGFMSVLLTFHGKYRQAALWIIFAAVMDGLDGIVARATNTSSDFGIELDSLSDAVSFGLSTSILLYFWGLKLIGIPGVFFSFLFLTAGALRLARYNVRTRVQPDRRRYQGLTVPSAAIFMASLVFYHRAPLETRGMAIALAALSILVSFCMVSRLPYRNFLKIRKSHRIDIKTALFLAISFAGMIFYTRIFLLVFFGLNVVSGPVTALVRIIKKGIERKPETKELPS
jgi:CDP-diacylglycerol--serine O-phosphatidyltransferase